MKTTDNQSNSLLVAVDFGTSELRAIAAEQIDVGMPLRILGVEVQPLRKPFKNKGQITQTTNAGAALRTTLKCLANRIGHKTDIKQVFVSFNSQKMQVVSVSAKRDYGRREKLTIKHMRDMENECRNKIQQQDSSLLVISLRPVRYIMDGVNVEEDPVKQALSTRKIEAHYLAMVALGDVEKSIHSTFEHAMQADIVNEWVTAEPLSWALTTDEDSENGCAILDLGAQLTTLILYKNGFVTKTKVSPFGAELLTADLQAYMSNKVSLRHAELLKQKFAYASPELLKTDRIIAIPAAEGNERIQIKESEIANVMEARLEEILDPLLTKLNEWEIPSRIYITGGGAMLKGIESFVQKRTHIPTEIATHADWLDRNAPDLCYEPRFATLIGTLLMAADHKREHPDNKVLVKAPFKRLSDYFKKRTENIGDLFAEQS